MRSRRTLLRTNSLTRFPFWLCAKHTPVLKEKQFSDMCFSVQPIQKRPQHHRVHLRTTGHWVSCYDEKQNTKGGEGYRVDVRISLYCPLQPISWQMMSRSNLRSSSQLAFILFAQCARAPEA